MLQLDQTFKVEALLDTGAEISLMTHTLFEAMQRTRERTGHTLQLKESELNFRAYGSNQPQKLKGVIELPLTFEGLSITHPLYVASHDQPILLIGMDLLSRLKPIMDCDKDILWGHKPEADHYVHGPTKAICACTLGWVFPDSHEAGSNPDALIIKSPMPPDDRNYPTLQEAQYVFGPETVAPISTDMLPTDNSSVTIGTSELRNTQREADTPPFPQPPAQVDVVTRSSAKAPDPHNPPNSNRITLITPEAHNDLVQAQEKDQALTHLIRIPQDTTSVTDSGDLIDDAYFQALWKQKEWLSLRDGLLTPPMENHQDATRP
ncbi:hypothetical protein SKAU_G00324980 [Synaphobranchus kaupii]|uniref:Peptidase A2 domain-containing protein n=1 Tax=Synaphobranchus kaupii TaxID=118154 RepID=A0A9Q1IJ74_SYNKA|nr:hypothetical protein SKAU_G00324980 [Synaphobranchus kaupii]